MTDALNNLRKLLSDAAPAAAIETLLEGLPSEERLTTVMGLRGRAVRQLFECAASARPLRFEDIVVPAAADNETVIYEGRNSMPLLSRFQKRLTRRPDGLLIGYNHQSMSVFSGPGYFAVKAPEPAADVPNTLYFDYTVPVDDAPPGWPACQPNDRFISHFVFKNMKDYTRRVAPGVLVGVAYKKGKRVGPWFVLCRAS